MKKITSLFTGLAAAAALFGVAGCTNQVDYIKEIVDPCKFKVAGVYVEGLDASYNGAKVTLKVAGVNASGDKVDLDFTTDDDKSNVGYKYQNTTTNLEEGYTSGTAFFELDKEYDGETMAQTYFKKNYNPAEPDKFVPFQGGTFECYLSVGNSEFKVLSSDGKANQNAQLSVPAYENGEMVSRYVKVVVNGDHAEFSLSKSAKASVISTLVDFNFSSTDVYATDGYDGLTCVTSDKADDAEYAKYTLIFRNLPLSQVDMKVMLAGQAIGPVDGSLDVGTWWYESGDAAKMEASSLAQTISKATAADAAKYGVAVDEVFVAWEVYGDEPDNWDIPSNAHGPALKIYKFGQENKDEVYFLQVKNNDNFFFPTSTWGSDVKLTIDYNTVKAADCYLADPTAPEAKIYIDAIKVTNAPDLNTELRFWGTWLSKCKSATADYSDAGSYKIADQATYYEGGAAYMLLNEVYLPGDDTFRLKTRVSNCSAKANYVNRIIVSEENDGTPTLKTLEYAGEHWILVLERAETTSKNAFNCWLEPTDSDAYYETVKTRANSN